MGAHARSRDDPWPLRWARDLARLVLPVECGGCGARDEVLCAACRALLAGPPRRCEQTAPRLDRMDGRAPLPTWALAPYTGPVRELVVAWKDHGRLDLTGALTGALAVAARDVAAELHGAGLRGAGLRAPVLVVPAPSSGAARRRRGADLVALLARAVAVACVAEGVPARPAAVLAQRRGVRDQAGLGVRARGRNLGGQIRWRPRAPRPEAGQPVLLVDDVLTTGATLAACAREVERAGGVVVGALTIAATPPPGSRADHARVDGWEGLPWGVTVRSRSRNGPTGTDDVVLPGVLAAGAEEVVWPDRP